MSSCSVFEKYVSLLLNKVFKSIMNNIIKTLLITIIIVVTFSRCEKYDYPGPIDYSAEIAREQELLRDFYENKNNNGIFDSLLALCGNDTIDRRGPDSYNGYIIFKTDTVQGPYDTITSNDVIGFRYKAYELYQQSIDTIFLDSLEKVNLRLDPLKYYPEVDSIVYQPALYLKDDNYSVLDPLIWSVNNSFVACVNIAILQMRKYGRGIVFGSSEYNYGASNDYTPYLYDIEIVYVQQ